MANALKLIAEAKEKRLSSLDLGGCGLKVIPLELAELKWLEDLNLSMNEIKDLKLLSELDRLRFLQVHSTQVNDLTPLSGLKNLEELDLSYSNTS